MIFNDINQNRSYVKGRYRPEIDGLRAFALVSVIINHFNKNLLPGGYLGVDIFFVISGFVITSSLYHRPSKSFKDFITGFYKRRIKRILPVLSVFVFITSIAICLFNPNPTLFLRTGLTSLFGVSNLYLLKQSTDYFAPSTELNVFTHTWSLGVEEQFYLLFPFLVWFSGFGRQTKNGARNLFLILGGLTILSLIGFLYLYTTNQPAAYFLMPTRFWEIATGCLIFILFQKRKSIEEFTGKIPPIFILILIIGVMYLPMAWAIASTVAVVILSAILIVSIKKGTISYVFFANPKIVYIGLISYSLYLWHWGVLSISRWTIGINWWSLPFQITLMLGLAIASTRYIESPLRKSDWFEKRRNLIGSCGGMIFTLSSSLFVLEKPLMGIIYLGNKKPQENSPHILKLEDKCPPDKKFDLKTISDCILSSKNGRNILSIGDSQTEHLIPLLHKLNNDDGFGVFFYSSCGTNFPSLVETRSTGYKNPDKFSEKYKKSIDYFNYYFSKLKRGDIILLSSRYEVRWNRPIPRKERNLKFTFYDSRNNILSGDQSYKKWKTLFNEIAVNSLSKGVKVIVFNTIPSFPEHVHRREWFNSMNISSVKRDNIINNSRLADSALKNLANHFENVEVFDVFSELCPETQYLCTSEKYIDQTHLSSLGSLSLYEGLLKKLY